LEAWFQSNLISEGHLKRGFSMANQHLPDFQLDVPLAGTLLASLQTKAIQKKLLPENFSVNIPSTL
jgi:hypothetical protein